MSHMDECNNASHTWSRGLGEELMGGEWGEWVDLTPCAPQLPSYALYQPVLSGATASNVKNLKGLPLLAYTLERLGKILRCWRQRLSRPL